MKNKVEVLNIEPYFTNSILIYNDKKEAVIIDAWGTAKDWINILQNKNLTLKSIYSTHGHFDHISASPFLADLFNIDWYLNHKDLCLLSFNNMYLQEFNLPIFQNNFKQPLDIKESEIQILDEKTFVYETPGHSKGSIMFYLTENKILLSGDTLFKDSIGRTDLPNSDYNEIKKSLNKIKQIKFDEDVLVISGHGDPATITTIKNTNPYFI